MPRSSWVGVLIAGGATLCELAAAPLWTFPAALLAVGALVSALRGGAIYRRDSLRDLVIYAGLLQGAVCAAIHVLPRIDDREQALAVLIGLAMMIVHALGRVIKALDEGTRRRKVA